MASTEPYRVTRGGADVYIGPLDGLIATARSGDVLANDLIYDPEVRKWVFARSLAALSGFPLKGRRASPAVERDSFVPVRLLNEATLVRRQQTRRRLMTVMALLLIVTSTTVLVLLVPTTGKNSKSDINRFVEDESSGIRIEGSGTGVTGAKNAESARSNMDGKAVEVDGRPDDTNETDTTGRPASLEGPPTDGAPTEALAQQPSAMGDSSGREELANTDKLSASAHQRAVVSFPMPKPEIAKPVPLEAEGADGTLIRIKATPAQRAERAGVMLKEAESVMAAAQRNQREVSLDELLAARYQAHYAARAYANINPKHEAINQSKTLMDSLQKAFQALCTSLYDDTFCTLKSENPDWPDVVIRNVRDRKVLVGMTESQMRAAWGTPVKREASNQGQYFCYDSGCRRRAHVLGKMVVEVRE